MGHSHDFECALIERFDDLIRMTERAARALEHIAKGIPSQRIPDRMVVRFGVPEQEENDNG